jgi:lipopolysaccharide export system permease protein
MRLGVITRYLIRAHIGPFLFSLTAITGLIFLNAVAQRIDSLVGKGLSWTVVVEFLILSLPHTVALSLPMSVLVAVLYVFSELTEHNELTAMAAGGVRPARVLVPLLGMGVVTTLGMLYFNDQVLPEANHRLKNLLIDVGRKSPTFHLREGVVNKIEANDRLESYFLLADRIDRDSNTLQEVTIYDWNNPLHKRVTHATRGTMAFNEAQTDLYLTLYEGQVREVQGDREGGFQWVFFEKQIVPLRGIGNELDRQMGGLERGDREMDFAQLRAEAAERVAERDSVRMQNRERVMEAVRMALGRPDEGDSLVVSEMQRAQAVSEANTGGFPGSLLALDPVTQRIVTGTRSRETRESSLEEQVNRFRVELQKKWAIAFACLVFTLLGPPLALRFPRGGVGLVVAASAVIFGLYYMGLIGGESLADRRFAGPIVTMWIPNAVFGGVGLVLAARMGRSQSTVRSGSWRDSWLRLADLARQRVLQARTGEAA